MFVKVRLYSIRVWSSWIGTTEYHWLDLSMLYADGIRLKNYEEDHTPLLF